jgi:hypothetical protein
MAGRQEYMFQFPAGKREYSCVQNIQTGFGVHSASYSMGTKCSFLGGKDDCSPSSSAKVKNEWSYIATPPTPYTFMIWKGKTLPCTNKNSEHINIHVHTAEHLYILKPKLSVQLQISWAPDALQMCTVHHHR